MPVYAAGYYDPTEDSYGMYDGPSKSVDALLESMPYNIPAGMQAHILEYVDDVDLSDDHFLPFKVLYVWIDGWVKYDPNQHVLTRDGQLISRKGLPPVDTKHKLFRKAIPDEIRAKHCTACGRIKPCTCKLSDRIKTWAQYVDNPDVKRDMLSEAESFAKDGI